jgi:GAF domain-containing protein
MPHRAGPSREPATLADRLLHATTPEQVIDVLLESSPDLAAAGACVLWSGNWPGAIQSYPPPYIENAVLASAHAALHASRDGEASPIDAHVLCDGDGATAVLHVPGGDVLPVRNGLRGVGVRMAEVLAIQRLHETVAQLAQTEKLQRALFAIADMAGSDLDMPDMLRGLHRIVGELMYAENFYIALYDGSSDSIQFLYFVDSVDQDVPAGGEPFPLDRIKHGPTWWTIHERKPWMGTTEQMQAQIPGPVNIHGADSHDWLGVPMLRDGLVRGVMVVQSYLPDVSFTSTDMALLGFVGEHILTALERKQGQEELERRVVERTAQLAETNEELRQEVAERKRGERLQSALYQIAALASIDESSERFFRHVHSVVSELLNADNFYIALVSGDGTMLEFPYRVDLNRAHSAARPMGRGLTEYTLRSGRAQLIDGPSVSRKLIESGEIEAGYIDSPAACWLGVPLIGPDSALGVVAVQSYTPEIRYDQRDAELLTFVAYQLASSIQRRRAADALVQSHNQLEERVAARTLELREQITVREQIEAQLQHQVMHDPLTGLPNRLYLRDRVERAIAGVQRNADRRFALLYLDIDRFKVINDSLGHLAGDQVLRKSPGAWPNASANPTSSRACRATSSPCCWKTCRSRRPPARSGSGSSRSCSSRCWSTPTNCTLRPASASPSATSFTAVPTICCAMRMSPCTGRRVPGDTGSCCSTNHCSARRWMCWDWSRNCAKRSPSASSSPTSSRSCAFPMPAWSVMRHWCAGTIPSAARCCRASSCAWPRTAARSRRSTGRCTRWPAAPVRRWSPTAAS